MFTRAKIFRLISSLPDGQIFTTRELLHLGSRSAVDNALFNMVCEEIIERLAWGVFRLSADFLNKRLPEPTLMEVATAKINAFARSVFTPSFHIFCQENKARPVYDQRNTVSVSIIGHNSSFKRVFKNKKAPITVKLLGIAPRKAALAATHDGGILQSFWRLGKGALDPKIKSIALSKLKAPLKKAVTTHSRYLPAWITNNILFKPVVVDIDALFKKKGDINGEPFINYEILDILRAAHNQDERGPDIFEDDSLEEGHDLEDIIPPPQEVEEVQDDEFVVEGGDVEDEGNGENGGDEGDEAEEEESE